MLYFQDFENRVIIKRDDDPVCTLSRDFDGYYYPNFETTDISAADLRQIADRLEQLNDGG